MNLHVKHVATRHTFMIGNTCTGHFRAHVGSPIGSLELLSRAHKSMLNPCITPACVT